MHMPTQLRARVLGIGTVNVFGHSVLTTHEAGWVRPPPRQIAYCPSPTGANTPMGFSTVDVAARQRQSWRL
jgi:hypothetical protein